MNENLKNTKIKESVYSLVTAFAEKHGKKKNRAMEELIILGIKKHRELESKRR